METPSTKTRCPVCGSRGTPIKGGQLKCKKVGCWAVYDANPNEHGRALHHNPEINFEKMERVERSKLK